jgi:hypothetical protein
VLVVVVLAAATLDDGRFVVLVAFFIRLHWLSCLTGFYA